MATQVPEDLIIIIGKYLDGTATPEEVEVVNNWYRSFNDNKVIVPADSADTRDEIDARLRMRLQAVTGRKEAREVALPRRKSLMIRIAAAAAILCIVSTGTYFFLQRSSERPLAKTVKPVKENSQSFENKIILTLADGSRISITDAATGEVITQPGFTITKTDSGQLKYLLTDASVTRQSPALTNTLETPSGEQMRVTFPDGSKVSINASSAFQFPVAFSGGEFNTKLDGEAYFEVSHDNARKFKVRSAMQIVEVLGTKFNISAYVDEPSINTTLLEGSIRITDLNQNSSYLIKPGQRSTFRKEIRISDVEAEGSIAWAEGYFQFDNADIKTVMRALERWYGISVRYEGALTAQKFEGAIDKKLKLQQVLDILEKSQVHFKLKGNEVTVMP